MESDGIHQLVLTASLVPSLRFTQINAHHILPTTVESKQALVANGKKKHNFTTEVNFSKIIILKHQCMMAIVTVYIIRILERHTGNRSQSKQWYSHLTFEGEFHTCIIHFNQRTIASTVVRCHV